MRLLPPSVTNTFITTMKPYPSVATMMPTSELVGTVNPFQVVEVTTPSIELVNTINPFQTAVATVPAIELPDTVNPFSTLETMANSPVSGTVYPSETDSLLIYDDVITNSVASVNTDIFILASTVIFMIIFVILLVRCCLRRRQRIRAAYCSYITTPNVRTLGWTGRFEPQPQTTIEDGSLSESASVQYMEPLVVLDDVRETVTAPTLPEPRIIPHPSRCIPPPPPLPSSAQPVTPPVNSSIPVSDSGSVSTRSVCSNLSDSNYGIQAMLDRQLLSTPQTNSPALISERGSVSNRSVRSNLSDSNYAIQEMLDCQLSAIYARRSS